jgi:hypothetical protein
MENENWLKKETQEDHGTRSRGQLEIAKPGSSSWMPYTPQGAKGLDDDVYHFTCGSQHALNPALVPWGLCDPSPL